MIFVLHGEGLSECYGISLSFQIMSSTIAQVLLSQLHLYHCIILGLLYNRNNNYVCQMYGSSINESSVFKVWYDSISDVERADVSVLHDVISVLDGYKQCDLSRDEILLTIEIICTK